MADTQIPYYRPVGRPRYSSFSVGNLGGGVVDYSPLSRALEDVVQLWGQQVEDSRQSKLKEASSAAGLEVRRIAFSVSDSTSPDYVADPAQRPDAFLKGKESIQQKWLKYLDDQGIGGHDAFVLDYEHTALGEEFDLRKASSIALNQQQEAELISTLDKSSRLAGEGTPEQEAQWHDFGIKAIEHAVRAGTISPVEGVKRELKFKDDVIGTRVRRDLGADAGQTEQQLLSGGYEDLSPEQRQIWLERASNKVESEDRRREASMARFERLQDKAEKKHAEAVAKEGDTLAATGKLTPAWIENHRDTLDETDLRHFYDELDPSKSSNTVKSDPVTYARFRDLAAANDLDPNELRDAFTGKLLARPEYDSLLEMTSRERSTAEKEGEDWLKGRFPKSAPYDPPVETTVAAAQDTWSQWIRANPTANPDERRKQLDMIWRSFTTKSAQETTMLLPSPRNMVGDRYAMDIPQTMSSLYREFALKHGGDEQAIFDDPDFREQSHLILQWQKAFGPVAKPTEAAQ